MYYGWFRITTFTTLLAAIVLLASKEELTKQTPNCFMAVKVKINLCVATKMCWAEWGQKWLWKETHGKTFSCSSLLIRGWQKTEKRGRRKSVALGTTAFSCYLLTVEIELWVLVSMTRHWRRSRTASVLTAVAGVDHLMWLEPLHILLWISVFILTGKKTSMFIP